MDNKTRGAPRIMSLSFAKEIHNMMILLETYIESYGFTLVGNGLG
jgi:hypothetical protein